MALALAPRLALAVAIALTLALTSTLTTRPAFAQPEPPAKTFPPSTRLTLVHAADAPPYFTLDAKGAPTGMLVEYWRLLAVHNQLELEIIVAEEAKALSMVEQGQADAYAGAGMTPQLEGRFEYSRPLLDMGISVFSTEEALDGMADLEAGQAQVGYLEGDSTAGFLLATHPGLRLQPFPTVEALAAAAALGKVRAVAGPTLVVHTQLAAMGLAERFRVVRSYPGASLRAVVRRGNSELLAKLNAAIAAVDPADMRQLEQRWLRAPGSRGLWLWATAGCALLVGISAFFLLQARRLRALADSRIREAELLRESLLGEMARHRKTQDLLSAAIEQSPSGIVVSFIDPAVPGIYNRHALHLLDLPRALDKNNLPPEMPFVLYTPSGAQCPLQEQPLQRALQRGETTEGAEFRLVLTDGTERWVSANAAPVRTAQGEIAAAVLVFNDVSVSRAAERELARFKFLLDSGVEEVYLVRPDGVVSYVNEAVARSLGYPRAELLEAHFSVIDPAMRQEAFETLLDQVREGQQTFETTQTTRTGAKLIKEIKAFYMRFGEEEYVCAFGRDITERMTMQRELESTRALFAAALDQATVGIAIGDAATDKITSVNQAAAAMLGYEPQDFVGQPVDVHMPDWTFQDMNGETPMPGETPLSLATRQGVFIRDMEVRLIRPGRPDTWILASAAPVRAAEGSILAGIVIMADITSRKHMERQLLHKAMHDPLTGLANRALCLERIRQAVEAAQQTNSIFAVAFIDLDRFKMLNDSLGHSFGDRVLVEAAKRLTDGVSVQDMVCRFGGDEFVLVVDGPRSSEENQTVIRNVVESLRHPFFVDGQEVRLTASVGVVTGPTADSPTAESILQNADVAMHRAKDAGRDRIRMFHPGMLRRAVELMALDADMRRALELKEFLVYFQPVYSTDGVTVRGLEALARWKNPARGLVGPDQFIPHAEESGLIVPLGDWVLRRACAIMAAWRAAHPEARGLFLAVNLSGRQFAQPDIVETVRQVLTESGLPPAALKIEITESTLMSDPEGALTAMRRLKALGVSLAIDDFGTGYSSLAYLQRFPVDVLKIDRAFVRDLPREESDSRALVRAIMALAHSLRLTVIAEGVETREQLEILKSFGCEAVQGFLFSPAVPEVGVAALFNTPTK